jgi:hypothetical protein
LQASIEGHTATFYWLLTFALLLQRCSRLFYIYPINAVLFAQAGGSHSGDEIRGMAGDWIFADRLRFAVGVIGFLAALQAFRLPLLVCQGKADRSSSAA